MKSLGDTVAALANDDIRVLCADGVYCVTLRDVTLVSVGMVIKSEVDCFASHFAEIVLGTYPGESCPSYMSLFQCLIDVVARFSSLDLRERVCQLHGDFADGLRAAMTQTFPHALRTLDPKWMIYGGFLHYGFFPC